MTTGTDGTDGPVAQAGADEPELNQIRIYSILADVGDFAEALRDPGNATRVALRPDLGLDGELYLARRTSPEPRWLEFLRGLTDEDVDWTPSARMSAVLFMRRGTARYALTFGFGSLMLRRDATEPDYGLKVAAGLVDPDRLASLDARSIDAMSIQVRRQSSRGLQSQAIGFDVGREMLRALAGPLMDENLGTRIVGSSSVGLTGALSMEALPERLDRLNQAYVEGRYRERFGHIDRWQRVGPGRRREQLDIELIGTLGRMREGILDGEDPRGLPGGAALPVLEAPEVIDFQVAGFRSNVEPDAARHPFPDLDAYLAGATRRTPSLADVGRNHELQLISDESGDVILSWPVYGALHWELELDDAVYVLAEGGWWRIDPNYRDRIDAVVGAIPNAVLERPAKDPIEWEVDYNVRLAGHREGRGFLDRQLARFEYEAGTVEPCDVFTPDGQFVHVKPETSSAALSHLFGQGYVSARLFRSMPEYRAELRRLLAPVANLVALIPETRPDPSAYEVVFGIVTPHAPPIGPTLPFFARNYLARVSADIELMGYRVSLANIEEEIGARPADAGLLFRERVQATSRVRVLGSPRGRRARQVMGQPDVIEAVTDSPAG